MPLVISDELGMELHDRYTLDEPLTSQEQTQLEAWYAQQDSAEAALLEQNQPQLPNLAMLQAQLDATLAQLTGPVSLFSGCGFADVSAVESHGSSALLIALCHEAKKLVILYLNVR